MALVLTRKKDESVIITTTSGERITVGVFQIRQEKVRLGFTATPGVKIHRKEVQDQVDAQHLGGKDARPRMAS